MLAWAILLAGAVLLGILWPWLPSTWVIHYGFNGEPNGWAHKDVLGVFFPIMLGAFMVGTTQFLKPLARSRQNPWVKDPESVQKFNQTNAGAVDIISSTIALIMVGWSIILPLRPDLLFVAILGTFLAIGLSVVMIVQNLQKTLTEVGAPKGFTGIAYNNPEDKRLWVPKLSGLGSTLNFAHPWAWPVMLALLALPAAAILLVLVQALKQV